MHDVVITFRTSICGKLTSMPACRIHEHLLVTTIHVEVVSVHDRFFSYMIDAPDTFTASIWWLSALMRPHPLVCYTVAMPAMCGAMSPCPGTSKASSVSTCKNDCQYDCKPLLSDAVCAGTSALILSTSHWLCR